MRCHFHLVSYMGGVPDEFGIEVPNPLQAYTDAEAAIRELRCEDQDADWTGWRLEATDPAGLVMFAIDL